MIGALAIVALTASFIVAILARGKTEIPLVIVAPVGTTITLEDRVARNLPNAPNMSEGLASHYFMVDEGQYRVRIRQPGKPEAVQDLDIPASRVPVIYTLLNDTLREMKARGE